ncbi:MAG: single-stranded DNA-binding protein [Lachnospiraceae bacterium]|nr:single-stranded DNA-binding protein [Lachnospiraceae bacterium]
MNKVILMGRLTRDPEVRYSQGATPVAVARFSLAVDRRFKREGQPEADFFDCTAFGKTAEFAEKYLHKGTKMVVEGRLQNDNYKNREGVMIYRTQIVVENMEFAESKAVSSQNAGAYNAQASYGAQSAPAYSAPAPARQAAPAQQETAASTPAAPAQESAQQAPAGNGGQASSDAAADGFMNIPEGIDEELPFT